MNATTTPAELLLHTLLLHGPSCSREVQALMAERRFTPKQVRTARERLGVLAERSGNGASMRTAWRLPGGSDEGGEASSLESVTTPVDPACCSASGPATETPLTTGEHSRHRARFAAFMRQGMNDIQAQAVADALVVRDRRGERAVGSCAECQCLQLNTCPSTPRPAVEIHECWYRRQCTP